MRKFLGWLIMAFVAAGLYTAAALKYGFMEAAIAFGIAAALAVLIVFAVDLITR